MGGVSVFFLIFFFILGNILSSETMYIFFRSILVSFYNFPHIHVLLCLTVDFSWPLTWYFSALGQVGAVFSLQGSL